LKILEEEVNWKTTLLPAKPLLFVLMILSAGFLIAEEKSSAPENIRNIVPYIGVVKSDMFSIDDEAVMSGLYMQWIKPEVFQINSFIYGAGDLYNENLIGFHIIGDYYIKHPENGKYAIGAGFEMIKPDINVEISEPPFIVQTVIENTVFVPFIRAGRYFDFNLGKSSSFSIFHWAGYQLSISRGDILVDPIGPVPPFTDEEISSETSHAITGVKLGLNLMHVLDLSFKYKAVMNSDDFFNVIDTMANFYYTRNLGLSVRHKFSETESGNTNYTIYGLIYSF
jgi:hypothetical protein